MGNQGTNYDFIQSISVSNGEPREQIGTLSDQLSYLDVTPFDKPLPNKNTFHTYRKLQHEQQKQQRQKAKRMTIKQLITSHQLAHLQPPTTISNDLSLPPSHHLVSPHKPPEK